MKDNEFNREDLEFHISDPTIKGLNKRYIIDAALDKETQEMWYPQEGDIIVGHTGNIFTIGGVNHLHESIGGDLFYFNPCLVAIDSCFMDTPFTSTMNESGKFLDTGKTPPHHCSWREFRFVPYPHETWRMGEALRTKLAMTARNLQNAIDELENG